MEKNSPYCIQGYSLLEMLMIITVFSILMTIIAPVLGESLELFGISNKALSRSADAELIISDLRRDLRLCKNVEAAGDNAFIVDLAHMGKIKYVVRSGLLFREVIGKGGPEAVLGNNVEEIDIASHNSAKGLYTVTIKMKPVEDDVRHFSAPVFQAAVCSRLVSK